MWSNYTQGNEDWLYLRNGTKYVRLGGLALVSELPGHPKASDIVCDCYIY